MTGCQCKTMHSLLTAATQVFPFDWWWRYVKGYDGCPLKHVGFRMVLSLPPRQWPPHPPLALTSVLTRGILSRCHQLFVGNTTAAVRCDLNIKQTVISINICRKLQEFICITHLITTPLLITYVCFVDLLILISRNQNMS